MVRGEGNIEVSVDKGFIVCLDCMTFAIVSIKMNLRMKESHNYDHEA